MTRAKGAGADEHEVVVSLAAHRARSERIAHPAPFQPMASIINPDGSPVEEFVSTPGWKELRGGNSDRGNPAAVPITADWFLEEPHHRYYGRPWVMGRYYFDELLRLGLDRSARVLDLGCGAGRVGGLLAGYLDPGRYFGVDNHLRSLVAFAGYECLQHDLLLKRPLLMWSDHFEVQAFAARFDLVLDLFVTPHLTPEVREEAFVHIAAVCRRGAKLVLLTQPGLPEGRIEEIGFTQIETRLIRYPLLAGGREDHQSDLWHIYQRT